MHPVSQPEAGATAVEYAIIVAAIAAVIVASVLFLGRETCQLYEEAAGNMTAISGVPSEGPVSDDCL